MRLYLNILEQQYNTKFPVTKKLKLGYILERLLPFSFDMILSISFKIAKLPPTVPYSLIILLSTPYILDMDSAHK
jgi:hypothetical protein